MPLRTSTRHVWPWREMQSIPGTQTITAMTLLARTDEGVGELDAGATYFGEKPHYQLDAEEVGQ